MDSGANFRAELKLGQPSDGLAAREVTFGGFTLSKMFDMLDEDRNHKISAEEMRRGLIKLGKCVSKEEAKIVASDMCEMSREWKEEKDLDREEFEQIVLQWNLRCVTSLFPK